MEAQRVVYMALGQRERGAGHPAARAGKPRRDREGAEGNAKHYRGSQSGYHRRKTGGATKGARSAAG
jgi:hypothetical protein